MLDRERLREAGILARKRIDVRRVCAADDLAEAVVFHHDDHDVIELRDLRERGEWGEYRGQPECRAAAGRQHARHRRIFANGYVRLGQMCVAPLQQAIILQAVARRAPTASRRVRNVEWNCEGPAMQRPAALMCSIAMNIGACVAHAAAADTVTHSDVANRTCAAMAARVDGESAAGPVLLRSYDGADGSGPPAEPSQ